MTDHDPLASRDQDDLGLDDIEKDHVIEVPLGAIIGLPMLCLAFAYGVAVTARDLFPRR